MCYIDTMNVETGFSPIVKRLEKNSINQDNPTNFKRPVRLTLLSIFTCSCVRAGLAIAMGPMGPRANVVAIGGHGGH